ncbi:MAG: YaaR family protein [Synergistetes bacterium]|nr:YaaR family protein [Synergistota bacterium]MDW8193105.1 YaaR family protein [Synergistota bacterium]
MRIDSVSDRGGASEREIRKKKRVSLTVSPFFETLKEAELSLETEEKGEERDLNDILRELDEAASSLKDDPSLENLNKYKELVRAFLKEVLSKAYKVREVISRRSGKLFILVERVNKALEELIDRVLRKQFDALWLASKLEEIRGLLIDIYR